MSSFEVVSPADLAPSSTSTVLSDATPPSPIGPNSVPGQGSLAGLNSNSADFKEASSLQGKCCILVQETGLLCMIQALPQDFVDTHSTVKPFLNFIIKFAHLCALIITHVSQVDYLGHQAERQRYNEADDFLFDFTQGVISLKFVFETMTLQKVSPHASQFSCLEFGILQDILSSSGDKIRHSSI